MKTIFFLFLTCLLTLISPTTQAQENSYFAKNGKTLRSLGLNPKPKKEGDPRGVQYYFIDSLAYYRHFLGISDKPVEANVGVFKLEATPGVKMTDEEKENLISETMRASLRNKKAVLLFVFFENKPIKLEDGTEEQPKKPDAANSLIESSTFDPSTGTMSVTISVKFLYDNAWVITQSTEERPYLYFYMPGDKSITTADGKTVEVSAANIKTWKLQLKTNEADTSYDLVTINRLFGTEAEAEASLEKLPPGNKVKFETGAFRKSH